MMIIICFLSFVLSFMGVILGYQMGNLHGWRRGFDEANKMMDDEILKRWNKLNENRPD